MGRHDFWGQNDAKKSQRGRFPEDEKEGLNPSIVWGKTCEASKTKSYKMHMEHASENAMQDPDYMGGHDFRGQNDD